MTVSGRVNFYQAFTKTDLKHGLFFPSVSVGDFCRTSTAFLSKCYGTTRVICYVFIYYSVILFQHCHVNNRQSGLKLFKIAAL